MSTPNPNDPGYTHVDPDAPVVAPPRRGNPLGLILLLIALIVLGWWYFGRQAAPPAGDTAIVQPLPGEAVAPPPPSDAANRAAATKPAAKPKPRPVAAVNRDPRPLAGNPTPSYPPQALRSGVEGSVSVRIEVDAKGVPTDVKVVQRSGERSRDLDRAVLETVRKWRFEPALQNGKPVAGAVVLPVDFRRE